MLPNNHVWVFTTAAGHFPGGVFSTRGAAEAWISRNRLTGTLTAYPVDEGCLDWAIKHDLVGMKNDKLQDKRDDPEFIGSFSTASQEHQHYEYGECQV